MKELTADPLVWFSLGLFVLLGGLFVLFRIGLREFDQKLERLRRRAEQKAAGSEAPVATANGEAREELDKLLRESLAKERGALEREFRDKGLRTSLLLLSVRSIISTLDANKILDQIISILQKNVGVLKATIFFRDKRTLDLYPVRNLGMSIRPEDAERRVPASELCLPVLAADRAEIISVSQVQEDPRLATANFDDPYLQAKIAVPIVAIREMDEAARAKLHASMSVLELAAQAESEHSKGVVRTNVATGVIAIRDLDHEPTQDDITLLSMLSPLLGLALENAADLETSNRYKEEELAKRKLLEKTFSKYVSANVVDELLKNPEASMLSSQKRKISLLFTDIRGFTSMSENMAPEAVVALLNEYFTVMSGLVLTYNGTLDKYMGDAIMALYGAPISAEDDALRAVTTAYEMQRQLKKLNATWTAEGRQNISMGCGINTAEVVVGNIGSEVRLEYTAIGDGVNVASRLCANAKPGQILISEPTYEEIREFVDVQRLEPIPVKGKAQPVPIFEVVKVR